MILNCCRSICSNSDTITLRYEHKISRPIFFFCDVFNVYQNVDRKHTRFFSRTRTRPGIAAQPNGKKHYHHADPSATTGPSVTTTEVTYTTTTTTRRSAIRAHDKS